MCYLFTLLAQKLKLTLKKKSKPSDSRCSSTIPDSSLIYLFTKIENGEKDINRYANKKDMRVIHDTITIINYYVLT